MPGPENSDGRGWQDTSLVGSTGGHSPRGHAGSNGKHDPLLRCVQRGKLHSDRYSDNSGSICRSGRQWRERNGCPCVDGIRLQLE